MIEGWVIEDRGIFAGKSVKDRHGYTVCSTNKSRNAGLIVEAQDLLKAVIMADPSHESWNDLIEKIRVHITEISQ